jgi:tetratricopeptide (TPR) repeat protein
MTAFFLKKMVPGNRIRLSLALPVFLLAIFAFGEEASQGTPEHMQELFKGRKWKELVETYGNTDLASWSNAPEAFFLRGRAYAIQKQGKEADQDLRRSVERTPANPSYLLAMGENCRDNLNDFQRAHEAFRKAYEAVGKSFGWLPISATIDEAKCLVFLGRNEDALEVLKRYDDEDLKKMAKVWRVAYLRAYGTVYAALGREPEGLEAFREANAEDGNK